MHLFNKLARLNEKLPLKLVHRVDRIHQFMFDNIEEQLSQSRDGYFRLDEQLLTVRNQKLKRLFISLTKNLFWNSYSLRTYLLS